MSLFTRLFNDPEPDPEIVARLQTVEATQHEIKLLLNNIERQCDRISIMLDDVQSMVSQMKTKPVEKKRADKNPPD
jgi:hypothetical protein